MRRVIFGAWLGVVAAIGCSKSSQDGLPPATEWQSGAAGAPASAAEVPHITPPRGMKGTSGNPHAGMDIGGGEGGGDPSNPHAGLDMGGADPRNPHAGLDMGSGNPHAGGGVDVTKMGLAAPDPDRPIDPSHKLTGVITVDAKTRDKVKPGTAVFIIVKHAGPDGKPTGSPLAVDKLTWAAGGVPFELTDAQAMVAGTELTGDVVISARYDQDGDALSKEAGDVTGQLRVKIPAVNVKLALDTVLP